MHIPSESEWNCECGKTASDKLKFSDELSFWVKAQFFVSLSFPHIFPIPSTGGVKHNKAKNESTEKNPINADCCIAYKFIAYHGTKFSFLHRQAEAQSKENIKKRKAFLFLCWLSGRTFRFRKQYFHNSLLLFSARPFLGF